MAPQSSVGLTGGLFNAFGSLAGIVSPVAIGYIVQGTNSFDLVLLFVAAHGIVAVAKGVQLQRTWRARKDSNFQPPDS